MTALPMAASITSVKSAAMAAGSAMMSTLPSRLVATLRSSLTTQSVPTPRQSHWNRPWADSRARSRSASVSLSSLPSVSRMA